MSIPDMNVTQMHWKPKLIRLTSIYPQFTEGIFIDPTHVRLILQTAPKSEEGDPLIHISVCTLIFYYGNQYIHVKESTVEVARLCDEAFGYSGQTANNLRSV